MTHTYSPTLAASHDTDWWDEHDTPEWRTDTPLATHEQPT